MSPPWKFQDIFPARLAVKKYGSKTSIRALSPPWKFLKVDRYVNQRKEKRKYVARPGIEPRTSDLRVRCPTDCATRPGKYLDWHKNRDIWPSELSDHEISVKIIKWHYSDKHILQSFFWVTVFVFIRNGDTCKCNSWLIDRWTEN